MSAVEVLGQFTSELTVDGIPAVTLAHARLAVLDTIGAAVAGAQTAEASAISSGITQSAGSGPCAVWGTNTSLPPGTAAFVNGSLAHILEIDDFGGCGHSGAVVVPAVLAIGVAHHCSGKDLLAATVAGYEVASRVTRAAGGYRAHNDRGWHSTGTCGAFGAAAGASRALRLDPRQTADALGIAGSLASGLWAFAEDGASTKRLNAGRAAENGVIATYLAREGCRGPRSILEARYGGFLQTLAADSANPSAATEELGADWHTTKSGFKVHAACRGAHGVIDAVLNLRRDHSIEVDSVRGVEVVASDRVVDRLGNRSVGNELEAQLSIPYAIAVALRFGKAGPQQFSADSIRRDEIRRLMRLVRFVPTEDGPQVSTVTVTTADGSRLARKVTEARGGPRFPLSAEELITKFLGLVRPILGEGKAQTILERVLELESVPTLDDFNTAVLLHERSAGAVLR